MSAFDEAMAGAMPALFAAFGSSVTYTPQGGGPVPVRGVVGVATEESADGLILIGSAVIELSAAEVPGHRRGDTVTADGVIWVLDRLLVEQFGVVTYTGYRQ